MAQKKPLKKLGRPTKAEGPRLPHAEVDKLLVEGEEVPTTRGRVKRRFPSLRELAERFGVAHSAVAKYAQQHDCLGRRKRLLAGQPPGQVEGLLVGDLPRRRSRPRSHRLRHLRSERRAVPGSPRSPRYLAKSSTRPSSSAT